MKKLLLLVSVFLILVSPAFAAEPTLAGVEWQLAKVGDMKVELEENPPFILLTDEENRLKGHSGCNSFFGSYEVDGDSLKFGPIGATRMACPEPRSSIETALLKALEETRKWAIEDGMLMLKNEGGDTIATFKWVAETD